VSRSKKKVYSSSCKSDERKEKNRGFRRHIKLKLKEGQWQDLPEAPKRSKTLLPVEPVQSKESGFSKRNHKDFSD